MMSENAAPTTSHPVTCSWGGSRARIFPSVAGEPVLRVKDPAYFTRLSVPFARWNPASESSLWRTSQRSIAGGWIGFCGRFKTSGFLRDGALYPHKEWALLIAASGGSLSDGKPEGSAWPTPRIAGSGETMQAWTKRADKISKQPGSHGKPGMPLDLAVQAWPTPDAGVFNYAESPASWDKRRERLQQTLHNGNGAGRVLAVEVKRDSPPGRLSPRWVEALMGFPPGWTSPPTDGQPLQDHSTAGSPPEPAPDSHTTGTD